MLCTHCDQPNDSDARFCRSCGTALVAAPAATGRTVTLQAASLPAPTCPNCNRNNPAGARFCVFCATPLSTATSTPGMIAPALAASVAASAWAQRTGSVTLPMMSGNVHLLLRAVWFIVIGWWLGLVWTIFAWLFNLSLIFLPVGLWMLNRVPQIMTLRSPAAPRVTVQNGAILVQQPNRIPLPLRAIWFVLIGSWASLLWMLTAWALNATILLMPIAFWMFDRVPTITTLAAE
ncbi:MAG: zinc ribbon domain-containing protein [Herpetosiphonaceae bacterium]|nr:zinc ribbon domain-containing protein [Herpetosiphonaceae bacterium]